MDHLCGPGTSALWASEVLASVTTFSLPGWWFLLNVVTHCSAMVMRMTGKFCECTSLWILPSRIHLHSYWNISAIPVLWNLCWDDLYPSRRSYFDCVTVSGACISHFFWGPRSLSQEASSVWADIALVTLHKICTVTGSLQTVCFPNISDLIYSI